MKLKIFTTGGTIDKVYYDDKDDFKIGESLISKLLQEAQVPYDYSIESLLKKDSLELTDQDRDLIHKAVQEEKLDRILITHGTDTMVKTAQKLSNLADKTIVLTGALKPARFKESDAAFNVGTALAAVQIMPTGTYIAMNGQIFDPENCRKNKDKNRFETLQT